MNKYQLLKQYFGYENFRDGQEFLIDHLLNGNDVLGVMPTGAGKSICFQIPALMFEGITLVISPLISLMKDQVNALTQVGIKAAYINSSLSASQYDLVIQRARNNEYKIIYVAPERLMSESFIRFANSMKISMVAVDEAHCISQWGQDFRPSYSKIVEFIQTLRQRPRISAFTATATKQVREDIKAILQIESAKVLVTGFDRRNLYFEVQRPKRKMDALLDFLKDKKDQVGVIYCSTRKNVEEVCEELQAQNFSITRYHAGLSDEERKMNQDDFIFERVQMIVATNAFGMGIDKSNVSFVVHYNMPKNLESYYQEAGRAGRDGQEANCVLFYSGQDVRTNLYFIENGNDHEDMEEETKKILQERDRKKLKEMTMYCQTNECLRAYILRYFGEQSENYCGKCSSCLTNYENVDVTIDAQQILSCVVRMGERYGVNTVIDVLKGSKKERIIRNGLDRLSTYGISKISANKLHDIVNYLVLGHYLRVTNDEYPIVKLDINAPKILRTREQISMKLPKEIEVAQILMDGQLSKQINATLLAKLKVLRLEIANTQKVPAFVIFTDSTLIDMSLKLPVDESAMLAVSGVGEVKYQRYGQQFLEIIHEYLKNEAKDSKSEEYTFVPSDEALQVSEIAKLINLSQKAGELKVNGQQINQWLVDEGYLRNVKDGEGKKVKIPTPKGREYDLQSIEREANGKKFIQCLFGKKIQEIIVKNLDEIM